MSDYYESLKETARQALHAAPVYNGLNPDLIIAACMQAAIGIHVLMRDKDMPGGLYAEMMTALAIVTNEELTVALREQQLTPSAN